jgi:general secretion pathway protein A
VYQRYFGFQRAPFELVPDPDFLFLGESHESALANLVSGVESGKGFVAISGPVGAGKTTVLRALLRRIPREQPVCFLSQPEIEVSDLLRGILHGFGIFEKGLDRVEMRQAIRTMLDTLERPGILIVDEAHLLTEESLEQIRLLSNLEEDNRKLLQIILSGQPELKELLSRPRLRPLTQRIEMFYDIRPLDFQETAAYIDRRIRIAGNPEDLFFEPNAVSDIAELSGGIPRLINVLADRCLVTAYVSETKTITAKVVREAYEDLGEVTQSVMAQSPASRRTSERRQAQPAPSPAERPARAQAIAPPPPRPEARPAATERSEPAPERRATSRARSSTERADRWFAIGGIVAVALVAMLSLGNRIAPGGTEPHSNAPSGVVDGELSGRSGARSFTVQVATLRRLGDARQIARELRDETGEAVTISPVEDGSGIAYRVWFGSYETQSAANETRTRLQSSSRWADAKIVVMDPSIDARDEGGRP